MSEEQNNQQTEPTNEEPVKEIVIEEKTPTEFDPSNFDYHKKTWEFQRDSLILSKIPEKDLMEYLRLEQERNKQLTEIKEQRNERLFNAFRLSVSLAAIVAIVYLLKDNPTILVNILYIFGILAGFWLWKGKKDK